jgi:hypothetical protein
MPLAEEPSTYSGGTVASEAKLRTPAYNVEDLVFGKS